MLLFQLLPYFLAVQTSENTTWQHGPEYTFSGQVQMITSLKQDEQKPMGTGVYFNLKCRPREPDILKCQIENGKIIRLKPQAVDYAEPDLNDTYRPLNIMKAPFEMKFHEHGIESYTVEKTDPPQSAWSVNMAKLLTSQLSIGADLSEISSTHEALENFTVGECITRFHVTRQPVKEGKKEAHDFVLVPLERLGKLSEESIEVTKTRLMGECLRTVEPFFGTRYTLGLIYRDVLTMLRSSESKIFISKHKFVTETINENKLFNERREYLGEVRDHMKLTLESVIAAKSELEDIKSPISTDILPTKELNDTTRW